MRLSFPILNRRLAHVLGALIAMLMGMGSSSIAAFGCQESPLIPRRCHVWGAFEPGAWSRVKVLVETVDETGKKSFVKRTILRTLHESTDGSYTLHVETLSENGKAPPQESEQFSESTWYITTKDLLPENAENLTRDIKLLDQSVGCKIFEYRQGEDGEQTTHQDFFNEDQFPYFFKRVVLRPSPQPDEPFLYTLDYEVLATDLPARLGDKLMNAAETRTVLRTQESTTVVVELVVPDVPGGLLSNRTTERSKDGKVMRRETVELDDFGLRTEMAQERVRWQRFREWRRISRSRREPRNSGK